MTKPEILMMGPYPAWDLEDLESNYKVHKLWEAADRAAFLSEVGGNVRAIATRGEIGASAELMKALPNSRSSPAMASEPMPSTSLTQRRTGSGSPTRPTSSPLTWPTSVLGCSWR